jgi:hypothetical protein
MRLDQKGHRMAHRSAIIKEETTVAPVMLTPTLVEKMLAKRQTVQVIKFRTTCTDCLPNY